MKETDIMKRIDLAIARQHLLALETGMTFAQMSALGGGSNVAEKNIRKAQELLRFAMDDLVERLSG